MQLFRQDPAKNLLPVDGTVHYFGSVLDHEEAQHYFNELLHHIQWRNDEAVIYGKHVITARKVAWYADKAIPYTYSGTTRYALPWTDTLLALKAICEAHTRAQYNSCLLNLYHNGSEGMAWHSDDEKALVKNGSIASLSLGAERKFALKYKSTGQTVALVLEHGSLLEMKDATQTHWLHRLPPTKKIMMPRINLTFRQMMG